MFIMDFIKLHIAALLLGFSLERMSGYPCIHGQFRTTTIIRFPVCGCLLVARRRSSSAQRRHTRVRRQILLSRDAHKQLSRVVLAVDAEAQPRLQEISHDNDCFAAADTSLTAAGPFVSDLASPCRHRCMHAAGRIRGRIQSQRRHCNILMNNQHTIFEGVCPLCCLRVVQAIISNTSW